MVHYLKVGSIPIIIILVFLFFRVPPAPESTHSLPSPSSDIDASLSFSKLVRSKGYTCERHKVLTQDGYTSLPPVFLQHGVVDSSDTFIMNDWEKAPAFMFLNQGFDVWLGNTRGNKHSREHKYLDPDDPEDKLKFFDYSFEEMAKYDVTANLEYVHSLTHQKVIVVAHSQGATAMIVKIAEDQEWWKDKVDIFVSLGGVTRLDHSNPNEAKINNNKI